MGERFDIYDDGLRLSAILDKPDNFDESRGCPVCLVIHGFTANKEERQIEGFAKAVVDSGAAALRIDMYGHGESDGTFRDHTLLKWVSNGMAAINYIRQLEWVTDIYICGHSQGGLLTMILGAIEKDTVKSIIVISPGLEIPDGSRKGYFPDKTDTPEIIPDECDVWGLKLCGDYIRVAKMIDLDHIINAFDKPVLMIQGDADDTVTPSWACEAAEKYADCRLAVIEGGAHCFDDHLDLVQKEITDWLLSR